MDAFGRTIEYLRLSLTDRCNERCLYCLPHGYQGWEREPDPLTAAEIVRVARVAVGLGFRKFRLTLPWQACRFRGYWHMESPASIVPEGIRWQASIAI